MDFLFPAQVRQGKCGQGKERQAVENVQDQANGGEICLDVQDVGKAQRKKRAAQDNLENNQRLLDPRGRNIIGMILPTPASVHFCRIHSNFSRWVNPI